MDGGSNLGMLGLRKLREHDAADRFGQVATYLAARDGPQQGH